MRDPKKNLYFFILAIAFLVCSLKIFETPTIQPHNRIHLKNPVNTLQQKQNLFRKDKATSEISSMIGNVKQGKIQNIQKAPKESALDQAKIDIQSSSKDKKDNFIPSQAVKKISGNGSFVKDNVINTSIQDTIVNTSSKINKNVNQSQSQIKKVEKNQPKDKTVILNTTKVNVIKENNIKNQKINESLLPDESKNKNNTTQDKVEENQSETKFDSLNSASVEKNMNEAQMSDARSSKESVNNPIEIDKVNKDSSQSSIKEMSVETEANSNTTVESSQQNIREKPTNDKDNLTSTQVMAHLPQLNAKENATETKVVVENPSQIKKKENLTEDKIAGSPSQSNAEANTDEPMKIKSSQNIFVKEKPVISVNPSQNNNQEKSTGDKRTASNISTNNVKDNYPTEAKKVATIPTLGKNQVNLTETMVNANPSQDNINANPTKVKLISESSNSKIIKEQPTENRKNVDQKSNLENPMVVNPSQRNTTSNPTKEKQTNASFIVKMIKAIPAELKKVITDPFQIITKENYNAATEVASNSSKNNILPIETNKIGGSSQSIMIKEKPLETKKTLPNQSQTIMKENQTDANKVNTQIRVNTTENKSSQTNENDIEYSQVKKEIGDAFLIEKKIKSCQIHAEEQASNSSLFEEFLEFFEEKNSLCDYMRQMGGRYSTDDDVINGDKYVCFGAAYEWNPQDCTVLSFGIGDDWSFDDAMAGYGCKVYSFDPNIPLQDHRRSQNIWFYHLGVGGSRSDEPFKTERYESILKMLQIQDKKIDYLKLAIGDYDIEFFEDLFSNSPNLLKNIKQIGIMLQIYADTDDGNPSESKRKLILTLLKKLECHGFKRLHLKTYDVAACQYRYKNEMRSFCYEVVYGKPVT